MRLRCDRGAIGDIGGAPTTRGRERLSHTSHDAAARWDVGGTLSPAALRGAARKRLRRRGGVGESILRHRDCTCTIMSYRKRTRDEDRPRPFEIGVIHSLTHTDSISPNATTTACL